MLDIAWIRITRICAYRAVPLRMLTAFEAAFFFRRRFIKFYGCFRHPFGAVPGLRDLWNAVPDCVFRKCAACCELSSWDTFLEFIIPVIVCGAFETALFCAWNFIVFCRTVRIPFTVYKRLFNAGNAVPDCIFRKSGAERIVRFFSGALSFRLIPRASWLAGTDEGVFNSCAEACWMFVVAGSQAARIKAVFSETGFVVPYADDVFPVGFCFGTDRAGIEIHCPGWSDWIHRSRRSPELACCDTREIAWRSACLCKVDKGCKFVPVGKSPVISAACCSGFAVVQGFLPCFGWGTAALPHKAADIVFYGFSGRCETADRRIEVMLMDAYYIAGLWFVCAFKCTAFCYPPCVSACLFVFGRPESLAWSREEAAVKCRIVFARIDYRQQLFRCRKFPVVLFAAVSRVETVFIGFSPVHRTVRSEFVPLVMRVGIRNARLTAASFHSERMRSAVTGFEVLCILTEELLSVSRTFRYRVIVETACLAGTDKPERKRAFNTFFTVPLISFDAGEDAFIFRKTKAGFFHYRLPVHTVVNLGESACSVVPDCVERKNSALSRCFRASVRRDIARAVSCTRRISSGTAESCDFGTFLRAAVAPFAFVDKSVTAAWCFTAERLLVNTG